MVTHTGWLVCSQILPVFHRCSLFSDLIDVERTLLLEEPLHEKNNAAGWAFPWEDNVLVSSCLEISLDSMHGNSNNKNKIIEVISREILFAGKCIKSEITSAAVVSVLRPVGNPRFPVSCTALLCLWSQIGPCTGEVNPGSVGVCSVLPSIPCPPWVSTLHTHRMASLPRVLTSPEVLCSAGCKGWIYLICLKLTNPPVLRNKTNLRRGESSLFWNDQML